MPDHVDATCNKCGSRMSWQGKITDRPPCPKCGYRPSQKHLKGVQKRLEKDKRKMDAAFKKLEEKGADE